MRNQLLVIVACLFAFDAAAIKNEKSIDLGVTFKPSVKFEKTSQDIKLKQAGNLVKSEVAVLPVEWITSKGVTFDFQCTNVDQAVNKDLCQSLNLKFYQFANPDIEWFELSNNMKSYRITNQFKDKQMKLKYTAAASTQGLDGSISATGRITVSVNI